MPDRQARSFIAIFRNRECASVSEASKQTGGSFKFNKAIVDVKLSRRIGAASWWVSLSIHHDVKSVLPPLSYFEYTPISCCLLLAIMYKNCVVIKPEVHIISQRLQRSHDLR